MPESETKCPRCGVGTLSDLLERFNGSCPRCLLAFALAPDLPEFPNIEVGPSIGRGGMGIVYKAHQPHLKRDVALKILSPRLTHLPESSGRFVQEATALARLQHPGIVSLYEHGIHGGIPYVLLELIPGPSLRSVLKRGPIPPDRVRQIAIELCEALEYAHGRNVIHRDIKPENVLIGPDDRVKVTDFGLARIIDQEDPRLTSGDARLGTPVYMAPEQLENPQAADQRTDLYALGALMYEMLTGRVPMGVFEPPSKAGGIDDRFDAIIMRMLDSNPDRRPSSAGEVLAALRPAATPTRSVPWRWAAAALLATVLIFLVIKTRTGAPVSDKALGSSMSPGGVSRHPDQALYAAMAVDKSGHPVVTWKAGPDLTSGIHVRRWTGREWIELGSSAQGTGLCAQASSAKYPAIAVDAEGRPFVAWYDDAAGNWEIQLKQWNGQAWVELGGSASNGGISRTATGSSHPSIALDRSGRPSVAWQEQIAGIHHIYFARWDGSAWQGLGGSAAGAGVASVGRESINPVLALDGEGRPMIAWRSSPKEGRSIYLMRWNGTAWTELDGSATGRGISGAGDPMLPAMATDSQGDPIVAWGLRSDGHSAVRVRRCKNGAWQDVGTLLTFTGTEPAKYLVMADLVVDASDRPVVAWQISLGDRRSIQVQRWTGSAWEVLSTSSVAGDYPAPLPITPYRPALAVDPSGVPLLAWSDNSSGSWQVYLSRLVR